MAIPVALNVLRIQVVVYGEYLTVVISFLHLNHGLKHLKQKTPSLSPPKTPFKWTTPWPPNTPFKWTTSFKCRIEWHTLAILQLYKGNFVQKNFKNISYLFQHTYYPRSSSEPILSGIFTSFPINPIDIHQHLSYYNTNIWLLATSVHLKIPIDNHKVSTRHISSSPNPYLFTMCCLYFSLEKSLCKCL